jgi:hypothetical protein
VTEKEREMADKEMADKEMAEKELAEREKLLKEIYSKGHLKYLIDTFKEKLSSAVLGVKKDLLENIDVAIWQCQNRATNDMLLDGVIASLVDSKRVLSEYCDLFV